MGGKVFHLAAAAAADVAAAADDADAAAAAARPCLAICLFELSAPYFHFQRERDC